MENTVKEKIVKILNLSQKFNGIINERDNDNVIEILNAITPDDLNEIKTRLESTNQKKINKIRLMVVNSLLENKRITSEEIEAIKTEVNNENLETNILHSWPAYFRLFLPILYRHKIMTDLQEIADQICRSLDLINFVKYKLVDFDGATNLGLEKSWIAIYNKNQPNQKVSLQLYIGFNGKKISYGLMRNLDEKSIRTRDLVTINIEDFYYNKMITTLKQYTKIIIDDDFFKRYWKFSPGEKACHWNEMKKNKIAAIGWGNHDFSTAEDIEQIKELAPEFFKEKPKAKSPGIINSFIKANVGDVIYAFEGLDKVIGYGEIKKASEYSEISLINDVDYHNYLHIDWIQLDKPVDLDKDKQTSRYTFVDITNREDIILEINKHINGKLDDNYMNDEQQTPSNKLIPLNQIIYGPPGTGKTYNTVNKAIKITNPEFNLDKPRKEIKIEFDRLMSEGQIVFTTFHQSMSYEDFIEGIKPVTIDEKITYQVKDGIFKKVCQDAVTPNVSGFNEAYEQLKNTLSDENKIEIFTPTKKPFSISLNSNDNLTLYTGQSKVKQGSLTKENIQAQINGDIKRDYWNGYVEGVCNYLRENYNYSSTTENIVKNFVLIIDEINRGNVSQIFGELITLIEDDKRLGSPEALVVTLPYSKVKFGVPSNLYIIGTMNTADRSVEALDAALRRRFSFEEMPPNSKLIATDGELKETLGVLGEINLPSLLDIINHRIEKLLDKDHQIGHSYFISVKDLDGLKLAFKNKIIPLLQEYFFGDYGKIGLVLGNGFVSKVDSNKNNFAVFYDADADEFSERPIFKIKTPTSNEAFIEAIKLLLPKKTNGE